MSRAKTEAKARLEKRRKQHEFEVVLNYKDGGYKTFRQKGHEKSEVSRQIQERADYDQLSSFVVRLKE